MNDGSLLEVYDVVFSKTVEKTLRYIKKKDPNKFKKIRDMLAEIAVSPKSGTGRPEPLKHYNGRDVWSRRVNHKDRIVYEVHENEIRVDIISVIGHYGDK